LDKRKTLKCHSSPKNKGNGCTLMSQKWQRSGKRRKRMKTDLMMKKNFSLKVIMDINTLVNHVTRHIQTLHMVSGRRNRQ